MASAKAAKEQMTKTAIERLVAMIQPGDEVYTSVAHVSQSGMQRSLKVVIADRDKKISNISYWVAQALDWGFDGKRDAVIVHGTGMDMGAHLVMVLGATIFPQGFDCLGEGCPSNDHLNRFVTDHHRYGDYALVHRWI